MSGPGGIGCWPETGRLSRYGDEGFVSREPLSPAAMASLPWQMRGQPCRQNGRCLGRNGGGDSPRKRQPGAIMIIERFAKKRGMKRAHKGSGNCGCGSCPTGCSSRCASLAVKRFGGWDRAKAKPAANPGAGLARASRQATITGPASFPGRWEASGTCSSMPGSIAGNGPREPPLFHKPMLVIGCAPGSMCAGCSKDSPRNRTRAPTGIGGAGFHPNRLRPDGGECEPGEGGGLRPTVKDTRWRAVIPPKRLVSWETSIIGAASWNASGTYSLSFIARPNPGTQPGHQDGTAGGGLPLLQRSSPLPFAILMSP